MGDVHRSFDDVRVDDDSTIDCATTISRCVTTTEMMKFRHKWEVAQFSVHQEICQSGDPITSTKFGNDQYEFLLKLYPNGKDDDSLGYVSVFLQIVKCPKPKLQFRVHFSIETLDGPKGCPLNRSIVTINKGGIVTASKFFSIDSLKLRSERYLPDDILSICADLTVYGDTRSDESDVDDLTFSNEPSTSMRRVIAGSFLSSQELLKETSDNGSLNKAFETGLFSDFTIHCNGRDFAVHRVVLAERSRYFEALLHADHKEFIEGQVTLDDMDVDALEMVLRYLYTFKCPTIDEITADVMYIADRLLVDGLKPKCSEMMVRSLNVDNACTVMQLADGLNDDKMFFKTVRFFLMNRSDIMAKPEWAKLRKENAFLYARIMETAWELSDSHQKNKRRRTSTEPY